MKALVCNMVSLCVALAGMVMGADAPRGLEAEMKRISQIQESLAKADKDEDVGALADLAYQWTGTSPMLKELVLNHIDGLLKSTEDKLKEYKAKAADGNLSAKTSESYQSFATAFEKQVKSLATARRDCLAVFDNLDRTVDALMKREDVRDLVQARKAQDEVEKAVKEAGEKLKMLPKL